MVLEQGGSIMNQLRILAVMAAFLCAGCAVERTRVVNRPPTSPDVVAQAPAVASSPLSLPQMPQQPPLGQLPPASSSIASQEPILLPPVEAPTRASEFSPQPSTVILASTSQVATAPQALQPSPPEAILPGAPAPPGPRSFTLCDLEGMALANNPTLAQASARVQAARGTWQQVGRYPNPLVGYQGV